jgi:hypothetical protein
MEMFELTMARNLAGKCNKAVRKGRELHDENVREFEQVE